MEHFTVPAQMTQEQADIYYMREALRQAQKAFDQEEVPVGAVLMHNNKIIAKAYNQVELLKDATAHAEMLCLTMASEFFNDWRLEEATLYVTLEPCTMCAGAIILSRVKRLVWGAPDLRVGANGSWINVFEKNHPIHQVEVTQGVLKEEASLLMSKFFSLKRTKSKTLQS